MITEMNECDIAESSELIKEMYEKDIVLCNEKPNCKDISGSLLNLIKSENAYMFTYKEDEIIKGVCGFVTVPSLVDANCKQALEIVCNPLYSLSDIKKGKIFIRMIKKMEQSISNIKGNMFIISTPKHFDSGKFLNRSGYIHKENAYVKEVFKWAQQQQ